LADEDLLHKSPGFGFRPLIWHLAHIGVFESYWLLQQLHGEPALDERYERIFDPIKTPREDSVHLPSRHEMNDYLDRVRALTLENLRRAQFDEDNALLRNAYLFDLVLQHEYQHQETLAYLFHLLEPSGKRRHPQLTARESGAVFSSVAQPHDMILIPAGPFRMGSVWEDFAYDNEGPAHIIELPAFKIDRQLTTNAEYAEFIAAGGYARAEWWSAEGWQWRTRENWEHPLYWSRQQENKGWQARSMFEHKEIKPDHPVYGVSWYEAEAYACFRGKRLPTEAEWEKAASWDAVAALKRRYTWGEEAPSPLRCNFFDSFFWDTTPVGSFPAGASAYGCLDMNGNVWEWTSSLFRGYPEFRAFPYPEYSETWFDDDHRILKGGSWATRAPMLRTSFRNFFRRHFRIAFAGIRCAADV
jgi:iron(II)-dependent oxidoreductase